MPDPLQELTAAGVSVWLDDLSRPLLTSGTLNQLVTHSHIWSRKRSHVAASR
jgi:transaldolase